MALAIDKFRPTQNQSRMTLQAFLTYDDGTDTRYELEDGVLVEMGAESRGNIKIAILLIEVFLQLVGRQNLGIKEKIEVRSCYVTARDADLIIHSDASAAALEGRSEACLLLGEPNPWIVIEVVSPGKESTDNYKRDYERKTLEYADRGIPEYWLIDPDRAWVKVGRLVGNATENSYEFQTFQKNECIVSPRFPELNLTAAQILGA